MCMRVFRAALGRRKGPVLLSRHVVLRILCPSSFSAKEPATAVKTSSGERKEKKQEKKLHQSPQKDSEPFEKYAA